MAVFMLSVAVAVHDLANPKSAGDVMTHTCNRVTTEYRERKSLEVQGLQFQLQVCGHIMPVSLQQTVNIKKSLYVPHMRTYAGPSLSSSSVLSNLRSLQSVGMFVEEAHCRTTSSQSTLWVC